MGVSGFIFRGAMLNLKDCRCPTDLVGVVVCLKYPICSLSAIPGVEVCLFEFLGKLFAWFPISYSFCPMLSHVSGTFAFYFQTAAVLWFLK